MGNTDINIPLIYFSITKLIPANVINLSRDWLFIYNFVYNLFLLYSFVCLFVYCFIPYFIFYFIYYIYI